MPIFPGRKGTLSIFADQLVSDAVAMRILDGSPQQNNDNRIISVALTLQKTNPGSFVCLVTKDINMRIKAKGCGLEHVEDYRRDKILDDIDLLSRGHHHFEGSFWDRVGDVETVREGNRIFHAVPASVYPDVYPNMFFRDDQDFVGYVESVENGTLRIRDLSGDQLMRQDFWGLKPRNMEQAMALFLLSHPDIDLTILTGPAGSGKTLLALATAIHAIVEKKQYDKLIVARSTPPIAEDIGFLPGTEEEKMAPWLAAFEDNLEVLHGRDESPFSSIDYVKQKANIQFKSLNFMRGRSFNNTFIIIDEAQSLTQFQLKSLITRVGQNSRLVILGMPQSMSSYLVLRPWAANEPKQVRLARHALSE